MSRHADRIAAIVAAAPLPNADQLNVIASNLAKTKRNGPSATPASKRTGAVHDIPNNRGNIYA